MFLPTTTIYYEVRKYIQELERDALIYDVILEKAKSPEKMPGVRALILPLWPNYGVKRKLPVCFLRARQANYVDTPYLARVTSQCLRVTSMRRSTVYSCTMRHESWTITFPKELVKCLFCCKCPGMAAALYRNGSQISFCQ